MGKSEIINKVFFALLLLLFVSSFSFAQVATSTFLKDPYINEMENGYYNFSATLIAVYVPDGKEAIKQNLEEGKVATSLIVTNFKYNPLKDQNISVYSFPLDNPSDKVLLCQIKTNESGFGSCIGRVSSATQRGILFKYDGNESYAPTQSTSVISTTFITPPFKELVDASWLIVFFIIGVLIAALYTAGRKPISMFDITTPKVKGIKPPKPQKIKLKTSGKFIAATAAFTSRFYNKAFMDLRLLKAVNTAEKYIPNSKEKLKEVYSDTPVTAVLKLSENISKEGVRSKLIKLINSNQRGLTSAQKAKEKLQKLKEKAKSDGEQWRIQEMEKKIDRNIEMYTKKIKEYENDLKTLSATNLASIANLDKINYETFKTSKKHIDSSVLSNLIKCINDPNSTKINFYEIRKDTLEYSDMITGDLEVRDKINNILQAKIELERIYISEAVKILNILNANADNLSASEKQKLKKISDLLTPEKERIELIKDLFKKDEVIKSAIKEYGIDEYIKELNKKVNTLSETGELKNVKEKLNKEIKEIEGKDISSKLEIVAKIHKDYSNYKLVDLYDSIFESISEIKSNYEASLNKFDHDYTQFQYASKEKEEQKRYNILIDLTVLSKKSTEYLKEIYSREKPYYSDYPVLDQNSAEKIFDIIALKYENEIVYDVLYNTYISPFMRENTVEFAKDRIGYFEDKDIGRTVFDTVFDDIWYGRIDPKEEYLNLDMKLIGYYGLKNTLKKMEVEKIILADQPDSDQKRKSLDYINYFINTYSPDKLEYEEKKKIGYEEKKLLEYKKKKEIGYEQKKLLEYKKKEENEKDDKE